jgi:hypothetical protein
MGRRPVDLRPRLAAFPAITLKATTMERLIQK